MPASQRPPGRRIGPLPAFPLVAAAAFALALALPALDVPGAGTYSGLEMLLEGWRAMRSGVYAWLANPLFLVAVILAIAEYRRAAGIAAGIGSVLALTSFAAAAIARRDGLTVPDPTYLPGFYLWLGAQLALLAWCWGARGAHRAGF